MPYLYPTQGDIIHHVTNYSTFSLISEHQTLIIKVILKICLSLTRGISYKSLYFVKFFVEIELKYFILLSFD